jgi:hypothetical protein
MVTMSDDRIENHDAASQSFVLLRIQFEGILKGEMSALGTPFTQNALPTAFGGFSQACLVDQRLLFQERTGISQGCCRFDRNRNSLG